MRQRLYLNGKLQKTTKAQTPETLRKWLDNAQTMWSSHMGPLVGPGEFDPNHGHKVSRPSQDELLVTTTGGRKLRYLNVE